MKKLRNIGWLLVLLLAASPAFSAGGGGVEYIFNAGSDLLPFLEKLLPADARLDARTGSILGVGGFGYGVGRDGFKTGGFGIGFWDTGIDATVPAVGGNVQSISGGFGGILSGTQHRFGPVVFALNTRVAAGGVAAKVQPESGKAYNGGSFALLAGADIELGVTFTRWMLVSGFVGVTGGVGFGSPDPVFVAVPTIGARITWGSF